jgi:pSer/pThr/pTyr-binding forkhead associated (FHA) protein
MQKSLVALGGMNHGKVIPLIVNEFRIGRDAGCHLRPASTDVSRLHCAIMTKPDGRVFIRDLSSANGTIVNERYLIGGELQLHDGDVLEIGPLMFRFHTQVEARTTSPAGVMNTTPHVPSPNPPAIPPPGPPPGRHPMLPGLTSASAIPGRSYRDESVLDSTLETHSDLSDSNIFSVRDSGDFKAIHMDTLPIDTGHPGGRVLPDSGPKLCKE